MTSEWIDGKVPQRVVGAGVIFFAPRVGGVLKGFKRIIETPSLSYGVKVDSKSSYTNDGPTAEVAQTWATKVDRSGKFSTVDLSDYNLALQIIGEVSTVTTAAAAVTADPVNAGVALEADTYYQLGLEDAPHTGVRAIEDLVLSTGQTDYEAGDEDDPADYIEYLDLGMIYIPVGSTAIGAVVTADYDTTAGSRSQTRSTDDAIEGALRFVSNNTRGPEKDFLFTSVTLLGSGDTDLKSRDKEAELSFEFTIGRPSDGGPAIIIDGRPAA